MAWSRGPERANEEEEGSTVQEIFLLRIYNIIMFRFIGNRKSNA